MTFTKERAAVETLEVKGYTRHGGQFWKPPIGKAPAYITDEVPVVKHDAAVESLATDLMKRIDKITGERHSIATLSSLRVSIVEACRAAMLQGAEHVQEQHEIAGAACKCRSSEKVQVLQAGWALVPIEPTPEMCDVRHVGVDVYTGIATDEYYSIGGEDAAKVWKAMLAAAPKLEAK